MENINKEALEKMVSGFDPDKIPPDLLKQAQKMANSREGKKIIKELNNKGINQESVKKAMSCNNPECQDQSCCKLRKVIIMRQNGVIKLKDIPYSEAAPSFLHATKPMSMHKIINADLQIKVWYDADVKGINKRATNILKQRIAGVVIFYNDHDISIEEFLKLEKATSL